MLIIYSIWNRNVIHWVYAEANYGNVLVIITSTLILTIFSVIDPKNKNLIENKEFDLKYDKEEKIPSRDKYTYIDNLLKLKDLLDLKVIDESEFKLLKYKLISNV